jgi:nucleoid-associated protein YgaU
MSKNLTGDKKEETISMLLGLVVVVIIISLIFNFVRRGKGNISLPGLSQQNGSVEKPGEIVTGVSNYDVKKGDNLWKIADTVYGDGYKWEIIARENKILNPGQIEIGQKLIVPTLTQAQREKAEIPSEYKVIKGDNLWRIAVVFFKDGFQWKKIWEQNKDKVINPDRLEIGMTLRLR